MKNILLVNIIIISMTFLKAEETINENSKYLNLSNFIKMMSTPKYNKENSTPPCKIKTITVRFYEDKLSNKVCRHMIHIYNSKKKKSNIQRYSYLYKFNSNRNYIAKAKYAYEHGYIRNPYWDKIHLEARGMRRIPEFGNREYMIVYLKSGFFEGEFAIIEH